MNPDVSPLAPDLYCAQWERVQALERYGDVARLPERQAPVYVVFDKAGRFLGLTEARHAAVFPGRVFADLLVRRQAEPLRPDMDIETAMHALERAGVDHLPVLGEGGAFQGVVSRLSLLQGLVRRERQLSEERQRLIAQLTCELEHRQVAASVFDGMVEGMMVTDRALRILLVNRAFTETTGYGQEEVAGQTPRILQSGRHDAAFYRGMWRALDEEGMWEGEIWNRRKNGEIYPDWLRIQAVRSTRGEVLYYVGLFSDISVHHELRGQLLHMAYYDVLTGLPNRKLLEDRIQQMIVHGRRTHSGFSLLYLDLDRFKDLNDSRGHRFGDQVLVAIAQRLAGGVRVSDTVARVGGDEFVILLGETREDADVASMAKKLLELVSSPLDIGDARVYVGASIGISRFPQDGENVDALVMKADAALYRAKENGRNQFHFHSDALHAQLLQRLDRVSALRQALDAGGLWLAWQPQMRLADGRIVCAEALARWSLDGQAVAPAEFIALAEETGLIERLGEWVLGEAVAAGMGLLREQLTLLRLGINLSPLQLKPDLGPRILDRLRQAGVPGHHLTFELTESALSAQREGALGLLWTLAQAGAAIAVDDFGTGCSNLAMLKTLPLHQLKIDRSFVNELTQNTNDRQIVAAMIGMAHALGLEVVAEGVETEAQLQILRELGCDLVQGYLISPPVRLDALRELLAGSA